MLTRTGSQVLLPRSRVAGNRWPAVPDATRSLDLALQYQLEQSQYYPPDVLLELQKVQVMGLLEHAARTVPYYREQRLRLDERNFWIDCWQRIPVLTRSDVQRIGEALFSEALPPSHGKVSVIKTSGSTGRPIEVRGTELTQTMWRAFLMRDHLWHGRDFGRAFAAIRATSRFDAEPPEGFSARGWDPVYGVGRLAALSIQSSLEAQIAWLEKVRPAYLLSFPSNLLDLARRCRELGAELPELEQVLAVGEVVTPECRRAVADTWGVPLIDAYTTQEAGYLALQCPQHEDRYHVQSENVILEVIDDEGRPCRKGETGRVLVTALHNLGTALIRYEIGDYAQVGGSCDCGRNLPVLTKILGRRRNMLTLPDGGRRWPFLGENRYRHVAPIRQYQIIQRSLEGVEVMLVADRPVSESEEAQLSEIIRSELGHPFALSFSYVDAIPRGPGGKFEDFRSDL